MENLLQNRKILITGGTGTFGRAFVSYLLRQHSAVNQIIVFSRDEQKHVAMADEFPPSKFPISYKVGDVRDKDRLMEVCKGVDIIVHSAAIKHVPIAEQNPFESVKTNILGSQNIIDAARANGVERVVALSTDKASSPVNMYGATKLCLEKLFTYANTIGPTKFTVVRYGNIFGSKGSVVPLFLKKKRDGFLPITHPGMTRFSITLQDSIDLVMYAISRGWGGEVVVPIAPSYRITDVATAVHPAAVQKIVGIRAGEKIHELLFNSTEAPNTARRDGYYVLCPAAGPWTLDQYCAKTGAERVPENYEYQSGQNSNWLTVEQIQALIRSEVTGE